MYKWDAMCLNKNVIQHSVCILRWHFYDLQRGIFTAWLCKYNKETGKQINIVWYLIVSKKIKGAGNYDLYES